MLGKHVEVTITRPVRPYMPQGQGIGWYKGFIRSAIGADGKPRPGGRAGAYVLCDKPPGKYFEGTVIAIADKGRPNERCIVAAVGSVHYEPALRRLFSYYFPRRNPPPKLLCLYEKSCGAVVFRKTGRGLLYLLVKNRNGRHWGFPKGHVEQGESEQQTAVREVLEETGLHITVLDGFRETCEYRPFGKIKKQVVFFAARSEGARVTIQRTEIDHYIWASYSDAVQLFRYDNDLRVLEAAQNWLLRPGGPLRGGQGAKGKQAQQDKEG